MRITTGLWPAAIVRPPDQKPFRHWSDMPEQLPVSETAAVGPAATATVAPGGDVRGLLVLGVEKGLPTTGLITGAGDPGLDAVVRFVVCVGRGVGD